MKKEHLFLIFILLLTLISFYLLYKILAPFLPSIAWAVLLAMIFYPLFKRVRRLLKGRAGFIGLVAGPLVATVCLTLVEIYREGFFRDSEHQ